MNPPQREAQILLLEDSATDALLIEQALCDVSDFQSQLVHIEPLSAGQAHAHARHSDVVLHNPGLPDAHGLDTRRKFHRQTPDAPVVVRTGLDDTPVGL